ncbi:alpha/beta hydrolase fold protein [Catenulispora acidiphila DSM 44928]|uniref:Alpha/beta hydrolase fold protein n=1 Tax=Catenulispora acidiphila (strain DSM 44928 / JCM 14897 / NBRC 102108 / NRRL B-24433 / ID139908) TaxID=479433 RepID=C7QA22_CATAD|nr:alpha/beta hydrolase [Catenulispora acidiphila]ACU70420.1 alpha/beta hydrolase fold protein [Catenulispora acidiphila DSM 44928]
MADPRFHTVVASDGAELHVEEDGAADAPVTLVLAHGWTLSTRAWRAQAEALAAAGDVRVLRYDQRGHGRSTQGDAWLSGVPAADADRFGPGPSVDQLGGDLAAVLDQLVPSGPVVLAGHSMGGMTIMALADQRPALFAVGGRVAGVLLTNTSSGGLSRLTLGFPEVVAKPVRRSIIKTLRKIAAKPGKADAFRAKQSTSARLAVAQTRWLLFGRKAPRAAIVECNEIIKTCPSATLAGFFPALMTHEKRTALKALGGAEVEVVASSRDRLTPAAHARRLAEAIPGARLTVVPGTGHMLPMERPQVVSSLLTKLIAAARAREESAA